MDAGLCNKPYDSDGTAMEVPCDAEDNSLTLRYALLLICPLAGELDGSFNSLRTRVHGQDHVEAEHGSNFLGILPEDRVVECSRRQRKLLSLLYERRKDARVAMALSVSFVRQIWVRSTSLSSYLIDGTFAQWAAVSFTFLTISTARTNLRVC